MRVAVIEGTGVVAMIAGVTCSRVLVGIGLGGKVFVKINIDPRVGVDSDVGVDGDGIVAGAPEDQRSARSVVGNRTGAGDNDRQVKSRTSGGLEGIGINDETLFAEKGLGHGIRSCEGGNHHQQQEGGPSSEGQFDHPRSWHRNHPST